MKNKQKKKTVNEVCPNTHIYILSVYLVMRVSTKEECVSDEEDEGQMNETPRRQGKKGRISPDIPDEKQGTQARGVHDENGTSASNHLLPFISFLLSLTFVLIFTFYATVQKESFTCHSML